MTTIALIDGRQVDVPLESSVVRLRVDVARRVGVLFVEFGDVALEVAAIDHVEDDEDESACDGSYTCGCPTCIEQRAQLVRVGVRRSRGPFDRGSS